MRVRPPLRVHRPLRGHTASRESLLAAAVLAALAAPAPAQLQFDELRKRGMPADTEISGSVAIGDVDGDGDLDAVFGNWLKQCRLYLNDGRGGYTDATVGRMPFRAVPTSDVALGDVDGDGDLDLVVAAGVFYYYARKNRLFLNDGTGTFTDVTPEQLPTRIGPTAAIALGDVDGDGDLDIIFGDSNSQNRLYLNDGHGNYTDATAARMPVEDDETQATVLADVDADGDLDLILGGGWADPDRLYLNDGTGTYTDVTAAQMPTVVSATHTNAVVLGDVDGDGDLDMILASFLQQNRLYLNDGAGTYTDATVAQMPAGASRHYTDGMALGDVDGDGDLDLAMGNGGPFFPNNRLYLNDGAGTFTDATVTQMPMDDDSTPALALADVDDDGDLDMLLGIVGQNRLYLNDGTGTYTDRTSGTRLPAHEDSVLAVAGGDLDGDGDIDLVFASGDRMEENHVLLNDGRGTYSDVTLARLPSLFPADTRAVALGDVDSDGDVDIVFGNDRLNNRLYLNDGSATFTEETSARLPNIHDDTQAVALGDVDGDGDLDLVFGNGDYGAVGEQSRLLLNDGTGTFADVTAARMPVDTDFTHAVALGDVDGDGDLDLILANGVPRTGTGPQQNRLFLNDGTGTFTDVTAARIPPHTDRTYAVSVGDVDGDGDLDIVFGNGPYTYPGASAQNRLYLNDGTGTFVDATANMPVDDDDTRAVALGDVDGDGDLDMVLGNDKVVLDPAVNRLYLNDGTGVFTNATAMRLPNHADVTSAVAMTDVDSDGDLDIVFGNDSTAGIGQEDRLYLNLLRQLDAPEPPRIGQVYTLTAYARHGPPSVTDVAVPFISASTASIPLPPLGTIGLDPTQIAALPPFVVAQPEGVGLREITVPHLPGIVGATIYAQAVLTQQPFVARLTNVTANVIE